MALKRAFEISSFGVGCHILNYKYSTHSQVSAWTPLHVEGVHGECVCGSACQLVVHVPLANCKVGGQALYV